jgi:hypothetical protein
VLDDDSLGVSLDVLLGMLVASAFDSSWQSSDQNLDCSLASLLVGLLGTFNNLDNLEDVLGTAFVGLGDLSDESFTMIFGSSLEIEYTGLEGVSRESTASRFGDVSSNWLRSWATTWVMEGVLDVLESEQSFLWDHNLVVSTAVATAHTG